ncbi:MAG: cation:dicarboxylase symporter family transporter, partial [Gemmatimonadota bacterium]
MSFTSRVLLGLAAGLGTGAGVAAAGGPGLREAALWVEPVGTVWTRAIQLTVLPLVVSLLFAGVAGGGG